MIDTVLTTSKVLTDSQYQALLIHLALPDTNCCENDMHTFAQALKWMRKRKIVNLAGNIEKFVDLLCSCDCELAACLSEAHWSQMRDQPLTGPMVHGPEKWHSTILAMMFDAG